MKDDLVELLCLLCLYRRLNKNVDYDVWVRGAGREEEDAQMK